LRVHSSGLRASGFENPHQLELQGFGFGFGVWGLRFGGWGFGWRVEEMCSGSEAGSYLRLVYFVYHSTLGLRVIKKKERLRSESARIILSFKVRGVDFRFSGSVVE